MNRTSPATKTVGTVQLQAWSQGLEVALTTIPSIVTVPAKTYLAYTLSQEKLATAQLNRLSISGIPTTDIVATFGTAPTPIVTITPDTEPHSGTGLLSITYPPLYGIQIDGVLIYVATQADEDDLYTWLTQNLP